MTGTGTGPGAGTGTGSGAPARPLRLAVYTDARSWGGAEVVLGHLLAALGDHVEVTVLGVDADVVGRLAARRPGAGRLVLPRIGSKASVPAMWAHRAALRRLRPDVLHVNLQIPAASRFAIAVALTVPGLRVVVVEHLPMPIHSRLGRWLKRRVEPRLAAHVAVGERAAREVERLAGLRPGSIGVVPNGVPDAVPDAVPALPAVPPASPDGPAAPPAVGTLGRLDRQKGLDVLLRAAVLVPEACFVVAGSGPALPELRRLAGELGVADRMRWLGWTDDPRAFLGTVDVLALPSRFEGFPLTVLEAMLAGVPVVATDVGSVAEAVVDGVTGCLVPPEDPVALAESLRAVLGDEELRRRMAGAARARAVERFTDVTMATRYQDLYAKALGR